MYKVGDKVCPVIQPNIVMLVEAVQKPIKERYQCHWFVDGDLKAAWFGSAEIQPHKQEKIGFGK